MGGEHVLWAGCPSTRIIFQWKAHEPLVMFSLIWGGFAIAWEALAIWSLCSTLNHTGRSILMILWGIPFVLMGQYLIWGRFFFDAQKKRRTLCGN